MINPFDIDIADIVEFNDNITLEESLKDCDLP